MGDTVPDTQRLQPEGEGTEFPHRPNDLSMTIFLPINCPS